MQCLACGCRRFPAPRRAQP